MRKYRLFGIINPIDVLLIIAAVLLIWGAYLLARPQAVVADGTRLIRYTFEMSGRNEGFHQGIELGAPVYCGYNDWWIGTVVGVSSSPFLADAPDESAGIIRRTPVEGLEFTYIVIEAWANVSAASTNVGNFWVAVNRPIAVRSRDFAGYGFIINMEWVNEEGQND